MKLTSMRIAGGTIMPWWARAWRYGPCTDTVDVLPMPFCWIARGLWNIWCWSFRLRPNALECALAEARRKGREEAEEQGAK